MRPSMILSETNRQYIVIMSHDSVVEVGAPIRSTCMSIEWLILVLVLLGPRLGS